MVTRRPLSETILAALKQACAECRLDVADDLLRALETLDGKPEARPFLGEAYLTVAKLSKHRRRLRRTH